MRSCHLKLEKIVRVLEEEEKIILWDERVRESERARERESERANGAKRVKPVTHL